MDKVSAARNPPTFEYKAPGGSEGDLYDVKNAGTRIETEREREKE